MSVHFVIPRFACFGLLIRSLEPEHLTFVLYDETRHGIASMQSPRVYMINEKSTEMKWNVNMIVPFLVLRRTYLS